MKRFRIQERQFSTNIIEQFVDGEDGAKGHWRTFLCPLLHKSEGDIVARRILGMLNMASEIADRPDHDHGQWGRKELREVPNFRYTTPEQEKWLKEYGD